MNRGTYTCALRAHTGREHPHPGQDAVHMRVDRKHVATQLEQQHAPNRLVAHAIEAQQIAFRLRIRHVPHGIQRQRARFRDTRQKALDARAFGPCKPAGSQHPLELPARGPHHRFPRRKGRNQGLVCAAAVGVTRVLRQNRRDQAVQRVALRPGFGFSIRPDQPPIYPRHRLPQPGILCIRHRRPPRTEYALWRGKWQDSPCFPCSAYEPLNSLLSADGFSV